MEVSKSDWKLFRTRISDWQETYMERLVKEYMDLLDGEEKASDKFQKMEERIKKDKKHPGVVLELSKGMVGSMYSKGKINELINSYGMVIMDECYHAATNTSMELLQKINAKYVYGVSATPKRGDSMDRIIYMMLGTLRRRFTALERAQEQGIGHYFVPMYKEL